MRRSRPRRQATNVRLRPGRGATRSIAHFWPISKSQVYAELSRLEADGYLAGNHVEQDNRPDKRRYELTQAGDDVLSSWLATGGYAPDRTRSGFLAKFFFGGEMTLEQRLGLLNEYRSEIDAYRAELKNIIDKLEDRPESFYGRTALYGLLTAEAKIQWVDQMTHAPSTPVPSRSKPRSQ